jgi:hypothetical protein
MIAWILALALLSQSPSPLTPQQVLEAYRAGLSSEGIVNMIQAQAAVAPATEAELAALAQAGVPPEAIEAYRARLRSAAPLPKGPEDPRLADIVRLVRAGLSEELIVRQVRASGEAYKLSIADLIYLKEQQVPEAIIAALIATSPATPPAAAVPPSAFGPLLQMKGFLKRDAPGTLNLREDRLEWLDGKEPERNFAVEIASIKACLLECSPRPQGNFCYAIGIELFNGDTYEFRDLTWEKGDNAQILALSTALKKGFPQIIYHERVQ